MNVYENFETEGIYEEIESHLFHSIEMKKDEVRLRSNIFKKEIINNKKHTSNE